MCFLDAGVSGGVWGLEEGYCLMVGGEEAGFRMVEPALAILAPEGGYAHVGPSGAGHFVKMVHNGIEYGLMQAYAEGFELLRGVEGFELDLRQISALWQHGSVVRSWLLELLERAFEEDPQLEGIRGYVEDSGEGRWTVHEAIDAAVPTPAIALALFARFSSRQDESFAAKVNAALRNSSAATPSRRRRRRRRNDPGTRRGREPAPRGPARPAAARALRAHDLRRLRRPHPAQALPGALRARRPPASCRSSSRSSAWRAPR